MMNETGMHGASINESSRSSTVLMRRWSMVNVVLCVCTVILYGFVFASWFQSGPEGDEEMVSISSEHHPLQYHHLDQKAGGDACRDWLLGYRSFVSEESPLRVGDREFRFRYRFDRKSGFRKRDSTPGYVLKAHKSFLDEYRATHVRTMQGLIDSRGVPEWSTKIHLIPPEVLIDAFDAKKPELVDEFPYRINDELSLVVTQADRRVNLVREEGGEQKHLSHVGDTDERIYVARLEEYPKTILIRIENELVVSFFEDGTQMCLAYHNQDWLDERKGKYKDLR